MVNPADADKQVRRFLQHLATDRAASQYTQRNYGQALKEFCSWHGEERKSVPAWGSLRRDDFRAYLRFLGRQHLGRAAIHLRFSGLRTFYKFLVRHGVAESSPIKNLSLPKIGKRLPKFLTPEQMVELLDAPMKTVQNAAEASGGETHASRVIAARRDVAVLETIYSCGLRISELCGLLTEDIDWGERLVRAGAPARAGP